MANKNEMTRDELVVAIATIEPKEIARVYSGRPGCGCGCRGKYYDDARNIKRVLTAMRKNISGARLTYDRGEGTVGDPVAAVETDTRYYWAYFKK